MKTKQIIYSFLVGVFAFAISSTTVLADSTTVVLPTDMAEDVSDVVADPTSWFYFDDETNTIDNSLGSFVMGPDTAPAGNGGVEMSVSGTERKNLSTVQFGGTSLSDLTELKFSTYNPAAGNGGSITRSGYLHFNVDFDESGTWQSRLVYVPRDNGTVTQDSWQEWDALMDGDALWRYSGATWPITGEPGLATTKTWDQILSDYPDARMNVGVLSFMGIRIGEPYADGYTENLDAVKVGVSGDTATFDFEPLLDPPTTFDDCRNGNWVTYNNPSFKNQKKCIKYVRKNAKKVKANVSYEAFDLKRQGSLNANTATQAGSFLYFDYDRNWYFVTVSKVNVDGMNAYFAGEVIRASNPAWVGNWLFGKVEDGVPDNIWGSFATQSAAEAGVDAMTDPSDGPFAVTKGKVKIK